MIEPNPTPRSHKTLKIVLGVVLVLVVIGWISGPDDATIPASSATAERPVTYAEPEPEIEITAAMVADYVAAQNGSGYFAVFCESVATIGYAGALAGFDIGYQSDEPGVPSAEAVFDEYLTRC